MFLQYLLVCYTLVNSVLAVCCKNHNVLCVVNAITCTPNCPDKISYCTPGKETCANNGVGNSFGACVPIYTVTLMNFAATATVTTYTGTVTKTTSTQIFWVYNTVPTTVFDTSTYTSVQVVTSVVTSTRVNKLRHLGKRESTSTTTITQSPCSTSRDSRCTATASLIWTNNIVATITSNSAVASTYRSVVWRTTVSVSTAYVTSTVNQPAGTSTVTSITTATQQNTQSTVGTTVQPATTNTATTTQQDAATLDGTATMSQSTPSATLFNSDGAAAANPIASGSSEGQLSTGAKAAIGTTVGSLVIAVIVLGCLWRRKRKENKQMTGSIKGSTISSTTPSMLHGQPQMANPYAYQPVYTTTAPMFKPRPTTTQHGYAAVPLRPSSPPPVLQQHYYDAPVTPPHNQPYHYPAPTPVGQQQQQPYQQYHNQYQYSQRSQEPMQPLYSHPQPHYQPHQVSPVHEIPGRQNRPW